MQEISTFDEKTETILLAAYIIHSRPTRVPPPPVQIVWWFWVKLRCKSSALRPAPLHCEKFPLNLRNLPQDKILPIF